MKIPKDYIKRKGNTIPFGYKESNIEGYFKPIPKQIKALHTYIEGIKNQEYSLRQAASLLSEETGRKISHVALKNYIDKGGSVAEQRKKAVAKKAKQIKKQKKNLLQREQTLKKEQEIIDKVTKPKKSKVI